MQGWRRLPQGRLTWDEQGWTWLSSAHPLGSAVTEVQILLDLQRLVLLRMCHQDRVHCMVWADAATDPGHWLDFRRALQAHARSAGAESPVAGHDAQP